MVDGTAVEGVPWDVVSVPHYKNGKRYGDGDTVRLVRTGIFKLGDKRWRLTDPDPLGEPIRLPWVDTPESSDKIGNATATADLTGWLTRKLALGPLRVVCYDSAGWDRVLGDLIAADGESCSGWLLRYGNNGAGWPLYVKGQ
jgi:hypothetical protein